MEGEEEAQCKAAVEIVPNPGVEFESNSSLSALDTLNESDSFLTQEEESQEESTESTDQPAPTQNETLDTSQEKDSADADDVKSTEDSSSKQDDFDPVKEDTEPNNTSESVEEGKDSTDEVDESVQSKELEEETENKESVEMTGNEGDTSVELVEQEIDETITTEEELDDSKIEEENEESMNLDTSNEQINGDLLQETGENHPPAELLDESATDFISQEQEVNEPSLQPTEISSAEMGESSPAESKRQRKASHKVIEMAETAFTLSTPVTKVKKSTNKKTKAGKGKGATTVEGIDITSTPKEETTPLKGGKKNKEEKVTQLSDGWTVKAVQRQSGVSVGKYDIYYFSPEGKKFRSKNEIRNFMDKTGLELNLESFEFSAGHLVSKGIMQLEGVENKEKKALKTPFKPRQGGGVTKASQKILKKKSVLKHAKFALKGRKKLQADDNVDSEENKDQQPLQKLVIKMPFGSGFGKMRMTKKETSQIRSYFAPNEEETPPGFDHYDFDAESEMERSLLIDESERPAQEEIFTKVVKKTPKKFSQVKKISPEKVTIPKPMQKTPGTGKKKGRKRKNEESGPVGVGVETSSPIKRPRGRPPKVKKVEGVVNNVTDVEEIPTSVDDVQTAFGFDDGEINTPQDLDTSLEEAAVSLNDATASLDDATASPDDATASPENVDSSHNDADVSLDRSGVSIDNLNASLGNGPDSMDTSQLLDSDSQKESTPTVVKRKRGRPPKKKNVGQTKQEVTSPRKEEVSWEEYQKQLAGEDTVSKDEVVKSEIEIKSQTGSQDEIENESIEDKSGFEEEIIESELTSAEILAEAREYAKVPEEITADYILNNISNLKNNRSVKKAIPAPIITTRPKSKREEKWVPPHSPFSLVQESLSHDPWKLLVATILLNKSTGFPLGGQIIPILWKLLNRWPTPELASCAKVEEMASVLFPLGFNYKRAITVIKFSEEFLKKKWTYPIELHGIGKYGNDSYRIFCIDEWKKVEPSDQKLTDYQHWLLANQKQLGLA